MSRVAFVSSGRRAFRRRFTVSSWSPCVLTAPVRSRHNRSTSVLARWCFSPAAWSCAYIRMFVSTKYLSLMQLVPRPGRCPLEVETFAQPGQRAALRFVVRLPLPHQRFEPLGQERADGPSLFGREDAGLAK